ncbi:MAG: antibiotic biosynthesis monooxygenase family protein [Pseudomonadota bacterium]
MPIRSLIEFNVNPGAESAFEATYLEHGFLDRARTMPGFLSGEFLRSSSGSSFWAIALWASEADYEAWQRAYLTVFSEEEIQDLGQHLSKAPQGFTTTIVSTVDTDQKD